MEAVAQASVRGFHEVPARPGQESDAAQGNTERPGIARQARFIRCACAGDDPHLARAYGQAEHVATACNHPGVDALSIDQQMQVGVAGQREAGARPGALKQSPPDCIHHRATGQHWRAWFLRWQMPAGVGVLE